MVNKPNRLSVVSDPQYQGKVVAVGVSAAGERVVVSMPDGEDTLENFEKRVKIQLLQGETVRLVEGRFNANAAKETPEEELIAMFGANIARSMIERAKKEQA